MPDGAPSATGPGVVKGRSRVALAILSVTAVLAATTFAVVALTRPDGAGSAEEAVEQLFASIEAEDAIGVMESLPPGERDVLIEPVVQTVGELQRLGIFESFALEDVPGADIEVEGLTLSATNLGPGVTKVRVTGGSITGTVIPDEVPIGPRTRELAERQGEGIDIQADSSTEDLGDSDLELVAIEEDGGWHVSLFYTIAEAARGDDQPLPQFGGELIAPIGADSPEGAVRGLLDAGLALDLASVVGHLPPDEMRVAYDYVPLFLDDADSAADDARDAGFQAKVERLDLRAEGDGDTRRVTIDALDVSGGDDETTARYAWDGTCTTVEFTAPDFSGSFGEFDPDTGEFVEPDSSELERTTNRVEVCTDGRRTITEDGEEVDLDEYPEMSLFPGTFDPTFGQAITVVEHDGRWYVSPVRTIADSMLGALRGLDGSEIDEFFGQWDDMLGATPGTRFEPVPGAIDDDPFGTVPPFDDDNPYVVCNEVFADLDADSTDEEYDEAQEQFEQCLIDQGEEPFVEPGYFGTPRFAGGHVLVPSGTSVDGYRLDGTLAWEGPDCDYGDWATPHAPSVKVDIEVASCGDELVGVDATNGFQLWRIDYPVDAERIRLGPATLAVVEWEEIRIHDARTGHELWSIPTANASMATADATRVYVGTDDSLRAFDIATGDELWSTPIGVTGLGVDEVALVARDSERVVRRIDPATGAVLWESVADNEHLKSAEVVAFTDDTVILQSTVDPESYVSYDLATGAQLWVRPVPDFGGQIVAGGTTVLVASDGSVTHHDRLTGAAQAAVYGMLTDVIGIDVDDGLLAVVGYAGDPDPIITVIPAP